MKIPEHFPLKSSNYSIFKLFIHILQTHTRGRSAYESIVDRLWIRFSDSLDSLNSTSKHFSYTTHLTIEWAMWFLEKISKVFMNIQSKVSFWKRQRCEMWHMRDDVEEFWSDDAMLRRCDAAKIAKDKDSVSWMNFSHLYRISSRMSSRPAAPSLDIFGVELVCITITQACHNFADCVILLQELFEKVSWTCRNCNKIHFFPLTRVSCVRLRRYVNLKLKLCTSVRIFLSSFSLVHEKSHFIEKNEKN